MWVECYVNELILALMYNVASSLYVAWLEFQIMRIQVDNVTIAQF